VASDPKTCFACGGVIEEKKPASAIIDLERGAITCFYHPACMKARGPQQCFADSYALAVGFVRTVDEWPVAAVTPALTA
jgi:hypothetical protein